MSPRASQACCIYREETDGLRLEVWDEGRHRSLWFDDVILQSEIDLKAPGYLPNPVNQAMLAPLMFDRPLRRVLLAGCGGGAIARWFYNRAPQVHGDAVEISSSVARLAREYFEFPPLDSHWRLLLGDVRDHLETESGVYDFVLVDLEARQQTPGWVTAAPFLRDCRRHLSDSGMIIINLLSPSVDEAAGALYRIRQVFDAGITLIGNPGHENLLVLTGRRPPKAIPDRKALTGLGRRWGLDLVTLALRLRWVPADGG